MNTVHNHAHSSPAESPAFAKRMQLLRCGQNPGGKARSPAMRFTEIRAIRIIGWHSGHPLNKKKMDVVMKNKNNIWWYLGIVFIISYGWQIIFQF